MRRRWTPTVRKIPTKRWMAKQKKRSDHLSYSIGKTVCLFSCPYPFPFGPQSVPRCRIFSIRFDDSISFIIFLHTSCYFFLTSCLSLLHLFDLRRTTSKTAPAIPRRSPPPVPPAYLLRHRPSTSRGSSNGSGRGPRARRRQTPRRKP